jgi:hypothetical protein
MACKPRGHLQAPSGKETSGKETINQGCRTPPPTLLCASSAISHFRRQAGWPHISQFTFGPILGCNAENLATLTVKHVHAHVTRIAMCIAPDIAAACVPASKILKQKDVKSCANHVQSLHALSHRHHFAFQGTDLQPALIEDLRLFYRMSAFMSVPTNAAFLGNTPPVVTQAHHVL